MSTTHIPKSSIPAPARTAVFLAGAGLGACASQPRLPASASAVLATSGGLLLSVVLPPRPEMRTDR